MENSCERPEPDKLDEDVIPQEAAVEERVSESEAHVAEAFLAGLRAKQRTLANNNSKITGRASPRRPCLTISHVVFPEEEFKSSDIRVVWFCLRASRARSLSNHKFIGFVHSQ